jgi:DASS family divalent anion:Na+ symporter
MAANPLAQDLAAKQNVVISWMVWFKAALVPGMVSMIVIPLLLYMIYPPETKYPEGAVQLAKAKLHDMGPISRKEWIMIGVFGILLVLWVFEHALGVSAATAALLGLCLILVLEIIDWKDVLNESEAWHTFLWLAILVTMSTYLEKYGFIGWFSKNMGGFVEGWSWQSAFFVLSIAYFYSHYFFASNTAHVSSMYAAFLAVSISVGTPPLLAALLLAFFSSLFSSMTHYGTSAAAVIFGANYVTLPDWWRNGLIVSIVNIVIWLTIGGLWWKFLEIW